MEEKREKLLKSERLDSKKAIEMLFGSRNSSFPAYPNRVVYMQVDSSLSKDYASILISVPKKKFKRAVKRNLIKRQIREAYRKNKHILIDKLVEKDKKLVLAFIWLDVSIYATSVVEERVKKILLHIVDTL